MTTQYQLILLGAPHRFTATIKSRLKAQMLALGVKADALRIIHYYHFKKHYKANAPAFCLYFGSDAAHHPHLPHINILLRHATLILPIVSDLKKFAAEIPPVLKNLNGKALSDESQLEALVNMVLEGLGLMKTARRLFISYRRRESRQVALQLYEQLEAAGFDVFLDTHSVKPGEAFQDELWHRLADTDVVVLLNTRGIHKSHWTMEELARASTMSIGVLQLIWPDHDVERDAALTVPLQLSRKDFGNKTFRRPEKYLQAAALKKIISQIESLRARSLAARQDNIITEFIGSARRTGKAVSLQPEKILTLKKRNGEKCIIIPAVGVPQALTFNQTEEWAARLPRKKITGAYVLYDHRNIREKWLKHLEWLNQYLPVKAIKIVDADKWLSSN